MFEAEFILILAVLFVSTLSRSTFGFGDALIAMPLLALFVSIKIATPLVALIGLLIAIMIFSRNWRKIKAPGVLQLIISSVVGIPIGLLYLKGTSEDIVKIVLAVVLISFSIYKLYKPELLKLKSNKFAFPFGIAAGILGGAYNTNGPPIIIYGTMRGWQPQNFRAILQGIFLPTNIFIASGHGLSGFWTQEVLTLFLYSLPVVFVSMLIGSRLNKKIPAENFTRFIYIFLILIGIVLFLKTVLG